MQTALLSVSFSQPDLGRTLDALDDAALDELDFGVIGFDPARDAHAVVRRYNHHESDAAGLHPDRVLGRLLFTEVAPCMNNYLVAQRFDDAMASGVALDDTIGYVLTLRMRPIRVALRLVFDPAAAFAYVLVRRKSA